MTCIFASSGDTKGFGKGIIMELFWVCGFGRGETFLFLKKNLATA